MKVIIKSKYLLAALLLVVFFATIFNTGFLNQTAYAAETSSKTTIDSNSDIKIKANGAVVMDAKNGNLLYAKDPDGKYYPASCTKIMTALVALENCDDLSKVVTVSHEAVYGIDPESSHIALEEGEKITMEQALYGLLLASANDAAVVIAEEVGGSIEGFADMMNAKAKELGLTGTHFVDPHGLYDPEHYTTPRDLAKITQAALNNPTFVKIFSTLKYTIPKTNKAKKRVLYNNHRMVKYKYAYHPAVIGGKSGYVTKSKFNLVTVGEEYNMNLIVVTMRGDFADDMVKDTKKLLDNYLNNYKTLSVDPKSKTIDLTCKKNVEVSYDNPFDVIVPKTSSESDITYETKCKEDLKLPLKKGEPVGTINAISGGKIVGTSTIYISHSESNDLFRIIVTVAIAVAIVLIILALIRMFKNSKKKKIKRKGKSKR